jgi:hypothetical protein
VRTALIPPRWSRFKRRTALWACFDSLFTNVNAQNAANAQNAGITTGVNQALPTLQQGLTTANNTYAGALAPTTANLATDQRGQTQLADALGLNGTAGSANAVTNWQNTNPGFQSQLDIGSQNVMRNQARTGNLASGATDADLQALGQNQANQSYQQYINNLNPFMGASTANAGIAATLGNQQANLQNNNLTNQANLQYGSNVAMGNNQGSADIANNQAAQNALNVLMAGGKFALGAGGFGSTGGSGGGSLVSGLLGGNNIANAPATGPGSPSASAANGYALSQGINPWAG